MCFDGLMDIERTECWKLENSHGRNAIDSQFLIYLSREDVYAFEFENFEEPKLRG